MLCAAGDICVNAPSTVLDSDLVCPMCNKITHAICIAADDEKEGCMTACYVDEELKTKFKIMNECKWEIWNRTHRPSSIMHMT
jgi:hypothetical protein